MSGQPPGYGGYGQDPYGQDPYGRAGYPPPAPGAGPATTRRGLTPLGRIGMILIALAGVAFAIAGFQDIVATPDGNFRVEGDSPTIVIGVIVIVLGLLAAVLPAIGLHLAAIVAGAGLALFSGALVIIAKTDDIFDLASQDPELKTGAYLAIAAFAIGIIGVFVALAGLIHKTPMQPVTAAPGSAGRSGKSIASLVLSIVGIFFPLLAALGMGFGILGLEDHRRSGGAIAGKGMSTAGIIIGLIVLVGYTVGIAIGIAAVEPGS